MRTLAIIIGGLALAGCNHDSIPDLSSRIGCPELVSYTVQDQRKAAEELRRMTDKATVKKFMKDYAKLRAACRVTE